jgi:hypothetical protein
MTDSFAHGLESPPLLPFFELNTVRGTPQTLVPERDAGEAADEAGTCTTDGNRDADNSGVHAPKDVVDDAQKSIGKNALPVEGMENFQTIPGEAVGFNVDKENCGGEALHLEQPITHPSRTAIQISPWSLVNIPQSLASDVKTSHGVTRTNRPSNSLVNGNGHPKSAEGRAHK